jgi:hypothetical protein
MNNKPIITNANEDNTSEQYKTCKRCGRKLKSETARSLGYGPVCWKKRRTNQRTTLF